MTVLVPAFLAACLFTALCSGSETAFMSASRIRALGRSREGRRLSRMTSDLLAKPGLYLTTTLVGTNVGMVLATNLAERLASRLAGGWAEPVFAIATAAFILVVAEVIPKRLAFEWRDSVVDFAAPFVLAVRTALLPLCMVAGWIPRLVVRSRDDPRYFESREEVRTYLASEGREAGREAERVLQLGSVTASSRMKPLDSYPAVDLSMSRGRVLETALEAGARFLLVFEPGSRALLGCVRTTKLLRAPAARDLATLTEGLPYFDRRAVLSSVLYELKRAGAHAGVVLGPDGQPEGLIDTAGIVEAILGPRDAAGRSVAGALTWRSGVAEFESSGADQG